MKVETLNRRLAKMLSETCTRQDFVIVAVIAVSRDCERVSLIGEGTLKQETVEGLVATLSRNPRIRNHHEFIRNR